MNKILQVLFLLLVSSGAMKAQVISSIFGKVTDEKNQPLDYASVQAIQGDLVKGGAKSDLNGNYKIKPLLPGTYKIKVSYTGYPPRIIDKIVLGTDQNLEINVKMEKGGDKELKTAVVTAYKVPLISASDPGAKKMTKEQIKNMPTIATSDYVANNGGIYQRKAGDGNISIGGDRSSGTMYMIDGMMIRGTRNLNLAPGAISSVELMTNGVSAKYGNATGGFPVITTNGITPKFGGFINYQRSIDGFNNNLLSYSLSGPLLKIRRKGDTMKTPFIGFSVNGSVNYDKDNNPSYLYYRLKPEVLESMEQNPLMLNPNGSGTFVRRSETTTANDFEKIKARENGQSFSTNIVGKIDMQATSQVSLRLGTVTTFNRGRGYNNANSLFAPNAHSYSQDYTSRNYLLLTHNLTKPSTGDKKAAKSSAITSAYYTIQVSYQKDKRETKNPEHKNNYFDYGFIGKFNTHRSDFYLLSNDSATGYRGQRLLGQFTDSVTFTRGGKNKILENYTANVYDYFNSIDQPIQNLTVLQGLQGLRNGDLPSSTYSLFNSIGSQVSAPGLTEIDQATVNLDASLDVEQGKRNVLGKSPITHNIQFGLGYDQTTTRSYSVAGNGLWSLMRQISNRHIQNYDFANPIFIVGGQQYDKNNIGTVDFSIFDTIRYNRLYNPNDQSRFDKSLRQKLFNNVAYNELIDIDNLDPSTFSLDMFSADDFFNQGATEYVAYFGYDYLGKKVRKQPSFNDFWTKKDARGDFTRPIGAFQPIYMYGYILDKFSYKDLNFNIGMRIDRYDANQKVLKDPYSLYGVLKAGDIKEGSYKTALDKSNNSQAPAVSTFSKDYVVYVDNNQSTLPTVVGYRKGDTWYDPFGKEIQDPTILSELYGGGLPIQPWLLNKNDSIKSSSFNPNNSFEDYKPQIAVSPRIQFTFPISDKSLLFGNYDVITMQPSSNSFVGPDDYYFLRERQATIGNANMRMEKGVNYSLGFQQVLSKTSALTIEAYYRERRNQIQIQRYLLAYPISYESYGNRDFSSTTGTTVKLEFRRPKAKPMRLDINYTLQFAEGTGSGTTSQRSLLASGQPNLRTLFPLNVDSRHMFNVNIDYRYNDMDCKGPKVGKHYIFSDAGLNINFRTRSGEPYTRGTFAQPLTGGDFNSTPINGTVNGSRLPWNYEFNIRLDKNIVLNPKARTKGKEPLKVNLYTYINNLLNTRNTIGVYRYTGLADDDAYLSSPQGIQALSNLQFSGAYSDLYSYSMFNANNFNAPRRIFVGFTLDF